MGSKLTTSFELSFSRLAGAMCDFFKEHYFMGKNDRFFVLRPNNCIKMRTRSIHNNTLDSFAG